MFSRNINEPSPHDSNHISKNICIAENPSNKNDLNTKSELNDSVSSNDESNIIAANHISDLQEKCRSKIELANTLCRKNLLSLCKNSHIDCSSNRHEKNSIQHLEFVVHDGSDEEDKSEYSNEFEDELNEKDNFINTNDFQLCCRKKETIDDCCGWLNMKRFQNLSESEDIYSSTYTMSKQRGDPNKLYRCGDKAMREWYVRYKVRSLGMQLMSGCLGAASSNESNSKPSLIDICNNQDDPIECRFNMIIDHVQDTLTQLQKICDGDYLTERVKRKWNTTRFSGSKSNDVITGKIVKELFLARVKPKLRKKIVIEASIAYTDILQADKLLKLLNITVNPQRELSEFLLDGRNIFIYDDDARKNNIVMCLTLASANLTTSSKEPCIENHLDEIMRRLKKPRPLSITWLDEQYLTDKSKEQFIDATVGIFEMELNILHMHKDEDIIKITDIDNNSMENSTFESHNEIRYPEIELGNESDSNKNHAMQRVIDHANIDNNPLQSWGPDIVCKIDNKCNVTEKSIMAKFEENTRTPTIQDSRHFQLANDQIDIRQEMKNIDSTIDSTSVNHRMSTFAEKQSVTPSEKLAGENSSITSSFIDLLAKIQLNDVEDFDIISSHSGLDNLKVTMRKLSMHTTPPETINEENNDISSKDNQRSIDNNTNEEDCEKSRLEKKLKQIKEKRKKRKLDSAESQKEIYRVVRRGEGYNPLCTSTSVTRLSISNKSFYNSIYGSNITKRIRNMSSKRDEVKPIKIRSQMSKHFSSKEFDEKKTSSDLNTNLKDAPSGLKRHKMRRRKITALPKEVNPSKFAAIPYTLQCGEPSNFVVKQCSSYNSNDNASNSDGSEELVVPCNSENLISMYNIESNNTSSSSFGINDMRTQLQSDFDVHDLTKSADSEKNTNVKPIIKNDEKSKSKSQIKCKKTIHKVYDLMKQIDKTFQPTKPQSKHTQNESRTKCIKTYDKDIGNILSDNKINTLRGRKSTRSKDEYISNVPKVFINAKKHSENTIPSNIPIKSFVEIDKLEKVVKKSSYNMRYENKFEDHKNVATMDLPTINTFESQHLRSRQHDMKQEKNKSRQIYGNLHNIICSPSLNTVQECNEESGLGMGSRKTPVHQAEKNFSQIRRQITQLRDEVKEAYGEAVRGPTLDRIDFLSQPKKKHAAHDKKNVTNKKVSSNFPITGNIESIQIGELRLGNRSNNSQNYLDIHTKSSVTYTSEVRIISPRPGHRPQTSPRSAQNCLEQNVQRKYHEHEVPRHFKGRKKITQSCPSIPRPTKHFDKNYAKILSTSTLQQNHASMKLNGANKKIQEIFKYVAELKPIIERSKINYDYNEDEEVKDFSLQEESTVDEYDKISNSGNGDNDTSSNPNNSVVNELITHDNLISHGGKENVAKTAKDYLMPNMIYNFSHDCNNLLISSFLRQLELALDDEITRNTVYRYSTRDSYHIPKIILCEPNNCSSADLSLLQGGDASSIVSKRNMSEDSQLSATSLCNISNIVNDQKMNYFVNSYSNKLVVPDCIVNLAYYTDNVAGGSESTLNEMRIEYVMLFETKIMHYPDEFMLCHHFERIVKKIDNRLIQVCDNILDALETSNNITFSTSKFVCLSNAYHFDVEHNCEVVYLRMEYEQIIVFEMISLPRDEYLKLCDSYSTYSVYLSSDGSVEIQNIDSQSSSRSDIASVTPSSTTTGVSVICRLPNYTSNYLGTSEHNSLTTELSKATSLDQVMKNNKIIDIFHNGKCGRNKRLGSSKMYRLKFENSCCYRAVREYKKRVGKKNNGLSSGLNTTATNTSYSRLSFLAKATKLKKGILISLYISLISTVFALLVIPDIMNQETFCDSAELNISHYPMK